MTAKQLRHAQMAAFAEFYTPRAALARLGVYPLKSRSWVANLAIWQAIRYYYRRRGRRIPAFRDFLHDGAAAWNYPDERWAGGDEACVPAAWQASAALERIAGRAVAASDPLVQAGRALAEIECLTPVPENL